MANGRLTICELKRVAIDKDLQAIVVLTVARNGTVTVTSYCESKKKCRAIGDWAQGLWKYAVSLKPFQTVFGWGNGGIPVEHTLRE